MADQLKEIAATIITPEDLIQNQFSPTIVATNASTQFRISEIVSENGFGGNLNIQVNSFKAAEVTNPFSNSVIVDFNSTVRAAFENPVTFIRDYESVFNSTSGNKYQITRQFLVNDVVVKTVKETISTNLSTTFGGLPSIASDGDFFLFTLAGNTSTNDVKLVKKAGGPQGTQTNVISTNSDFAFDGVRFYYFVQGSQYRRFDIETETNLVFPHTGSGILSPESQNRIVFTNGILVYMNNAETNGFITAVQISTGINVSISGRANFYNFVSVSHGVSFYYDAESGILTGISNNQNIPALLRIVVTDLFFTAGITSNSNVSVTEISNNFFNPAISASVPSILMTSSETFYIQEQNGGKFKEYRFGVPVAIGSPPVATSSNNRLMFTEIAISAPTTQDFPVSLKLRLAGVETT